MSTSHHTREPRPQIAIPDSPPYTPNIQKDHFGHRQPTSVPTPEASPLIGNSHRLNTAPRLTPELSSENGTIGLGLGGFDFPLNENEDTEKANRRPLYASLARPRTNTPTTAYSNPKTSIVSHLTRIPRRVRPILLVTFSLLLLLVIYSTRSTSTSIDSHLAKNPDLGFFGNGFEKKTESKLTLIDINEEPVEHYTPPRQKHQSKPLEWQSREEELLALIAFITGATGSVLPASVDPESPIDPSVLLGFDPAGPRAADDLEFLKEEVNAQYPLVLFGRLRDHKHAEVNRLLASWTITPAPVIVDVDMRSDQSRFIPTLARLLGSDELPQLVMLGRSLGGAPDLLEMDREELKELMEASEVITVRKGRRANNALNAEKERKEQMLRPQGRF